MWRPSLVECHKLLQPPRGTTGIGHPIGSPDFGREAPVVAASTLFEVPFQCLLLDHLPFNVSMWLKRLSRHFEVGSRSGGSDVGRDGQTLG